MSNKSKRQSKTAKRKNDSGKSPRSKLRSNKAAATKLRVIGGDMRGRLIHYHGELFTRPMKDSVRENLFNILGKGVRGTICYDLFSGTGALVFESLSRGSVSGFAVEQSNRAAGHIRQTAESLDVESKLKVLVGDAFRWSEQLLVPSADSDDPSDGTSWLVFLCPPYALWESDLESLNAIIRRTLNYAPPGSILVAETEKGFDCEHLPKGDWDIRNYGNVQLAIIEPGLMCGLRM